MSVLSAFVSPDLFRAKAILAPAQPLKASTAPEQVRGDESGGADQ